MKTTTYYTTDEPQDGGFIRLYGDQDQAAGRVAPGDQVYGIEIQVVPGVGDGILNWEVEYSDTCCGGEAWGFTASYDPDPTITTYAADDDDDYHYGSRWYARGIRADGPVQALEAAIDAWAVEKRGEATYMADPPPDYLAIGFDNTPDRGSDQYRAAVAQAQALQDRGDWDIL